MKSRGSQDPYVQEAILSVTDINHQIIQLQTRINELFRFPSTAPYLTLPLDQREESLIKNCIKRQGSFFLLLDYEPTHHGGRLILQHTSQLDHPILSS